MIEELRWILQFKGGIGMRRMGMTVALLLLAAPAIHGAVGNVAVRGITSTQAILSYSAPDASVCSVQVSESATYLPLVHDVDPALYAGANLDSRAESTSSGRERVFVVGKRRAEKGLNGHWYSRALQTVTPHYYRIVCGISTATGTFVTANIPLGNTYNEALPADPAVASRPYFATMGSYAWPEFINWNKADPTARPEAVIDPQTGILLKRLGMPQDFPIGFLPGGGEHNFSAVRSADGGWNIATTIWSIANGKLATIVVGAGSATVTTSTAHGLAASSRVTITGLVAGNGTYAVTSGSGTTFQIPQGGLPANTTLTGAALQVTAFAGTADSAAAATSFSGTGSNYLLLRDDLFFTGTNMNDPTLPADFLTLAVKAWCSGNCAGEDAKIQVCLTLNGVTCWPTNATAKYQEAALGASQTSSFTTLGTTTPILDAWTPPGFLPLNKADLSARSGKADIDAAGAMTWVTSNGSGAYFNPNWTNGSRVTVAGSECTVTGSASTKQMIITPSSCSPALGLPLTGVTWSGNNLGFLIRKKTAGTDTIRLQFAKYNSGSSNHMDWNASGSAVLCSTTLIQNAVTGAYGYHCINYANLPMLYWVDRKTADANFLGVIAGGLAGIDGINGSCLGNGTLGGTTPTAPESFYCSGDDNESPSKRVLISCTVNTTNQPGSLSLTCTNLTLGSQGRDLNTLIAQFTAADTPAFEAAKFACGAAGIQGTKLILGCGRSVQDTMAWTVVFDPRKVDTAPGCVGGGKPGCVVGAMSTWATAPARWCTLHTLFVSGKSDTVWVAGKFYTPSFPPQLADGPYTSTITSAALPAAPTIAAGTGACPPASAGCDVVTVDGEPCDASPAAGEATGSPCPKNPTWVFLQNAKVTDYFHVDNELVRLVAKNANVWTLQRGVASTVTSHSSTTMSAYCPSLDLLKPTSNWSWTWDSAADPHGLNLDGTTIRVAFDYDHPVPRPDVTIGGDPFYDTNCVGGAGSCYAVRDGAGAIGDPPNRFVTAAPKFAGASGPSALIERSQDHPSRLQDTAPASEKKWFLDGRPLTTMIDLSDAAIKISGSLYRLTSSTSDGDNLRRMGYNIYVMKTSATTLVAAGNCTAANPCPIWNDTHLQDSISISCTITLSGGTGTAWVSRLSSGGLGVTRQSALTLTSDNCPVAVGTGYPAGSTPMWSWGATAGVWAASGLDERGGSSGIFGAMNRKLVPTWAHCGTQPLIDASGPVIGDVLSDTAADGYKYCVARKGGECRSASQAGDIYMNCPNAGVRFDGSYGCMWFMENQEAPVDMCIGNHSAYLNAITQIGFSKNDFTGALGRSLTKGLGHYKIVDPYFHGKALPDGSWVMFRSVWTNGAWTEILLAKMPPFPPSDTVDRTTFVAVPVKLTPPAGLAVNNAILQFGYAENGSAASFYCTSRQEKCLATTTTVGAIPFQFASEGTGGTETGVSGLACATGCTITVPALSQRVLYYQVTYRNAANQTLAVGQIELLAVP